MEGFDTDALIDDTEDYQKGSNILEQLITMDQLLVIKLINGAIADSKSMSCIVCGKNILALTV